MATTKDGKEIISCSMTDDTRRYGPCATCLHNRNWVNCSDIREGDPSYCDDRSAVTERD